MQQYPISLTLILRSKLGMKQGLETRAQRQGDITDKWYVQFHSL
jgi:hypothetical protein